MPTTRTLRWLLAVALAACLGSSQLWAQRQRGGGFGSVGGNDSLFSVPRSQDDIHEWRQAKVNIEAQNYSTAVERLHRLLRRDRHGVVPVGGKHYLGLRTAVLETLAAMPEDGHVAYEKLVEREAGALLRGAFTHRNRQDLEALAWRFPTSKDGRRARLLLGDLALEAGAGHQAMEHYSALLFAMHRSDRGRDVVRERMAAAAALIGAGPEAEPEAGPWAADEVRSMAALQGTTVHWPCYGGGGGGARPMVPPLSRLSPTRQLQLPRTDDGMYPYAMHCVGSLSGLFLNNGHEVLALDPITRRRPLWVFPGPYVRGSDYSINQKSCFACAVSNDVVVAALQVPDEAQARFYRGNIELINAIPTRRLFAMDRSTGKLRWSHWDRKEGPVARRFGGHDAAGPPLVNGDTIYIATQDRTGAIAYYLSAYDISTGEPRWRSLICSSQGEVNMFGNVRHEFAASPLAIHDGIVFGCTNLGVCYAADARTGRIRWASAYDIIPLPRARLTRQRSRVVFFDNNPVVVAQGVMVTTPLDSEFALGFDAETGLLLWKMHHEAETGVKNKVKWLLGVLGDEVIFSGSGVVGVKLRGATGGQQVTPRSIRTPNYLGLRDQTTPARGAIAGNCIYFPRATDIRVFDRNGNAPDNPIPLQGPGNLLLVDGILVTTRNDSVTAYCNVEALLHDAERAIQNDPDNPAHYLHLAMLLRSTGGSSLSGARGARAVGMLKRGLKAAAARGLDRESPILKQLANELFQVSLAQANNIKADAPDRALAILHRARDEATTPFQWLQAQEVVLELTVGTPKTFVAELDRMALAHGSETYSFPALGSSPAPGRISVRAYALWQSIPHLQSARKAAGRCQALIEEFPTTDLGGQTGRVFAVAMLHQLLEKHGRDIYKDIEERAQRSLREAAGNDQKLREVELRFPHSRAADQAMTQRLDIAVAKGNLRGVTEIYSQRLVRDDPSAGMLRRLMVVAEQSLNRPLAHALAARLLAHHGGEKSDFPPDHGAPFRDVVKTPTLPTPKPAPDLELPAEHLGKPIGGTRGESTDILLVAPQRGFVVPEDVPLYTTQGTSTVQAYDLRDIPRWDQPLFPSNIRHQVNGKLLLCGTTLVVPEYFQVHGMHYRTGRPLWSHDTRGHRELKVLGVQQGVLHVYSKQVGSGVGGELLGIEPLTGTIMFQHDLDKLTGSARTPKAFLGDLWVLTDSTPEQKSQVLRLDGLTGRVKATTALPVSLAQRLDLGEDASTSMILDRLQQGLLVDENAIYLSQALPPKGQEPFVVALHHGGGQRWLWTGERDGRLERCGLHAAGIVVVQVRGSVATKFCVLATSNGSETRQRNMRGVVEVANWDPYLSPDQPQDQVLLAQGDEGTGNLTVTCMSLTRDVPSFRYPLPASNRELGGTPIFGKDFVAIPVISQRGDRRELFVINCKTLRGALPGGRKSLELAMSRMGFKLTRHGKYILYRDDTSVHVLGKGVTVK